MTTLLTHPLPHRLTHTLHRTERRLALMLAGLIALGILIALAGAFGIQQRMAALDRVTAPQSAAPRDLYLYLSDADATSTTAFLSDGATANELGRFRLDMQNVIVALTGAAGTNEIGGLPAELPIYTGQIEDAALGYSRAGLKADVANLLAANQLREPAEQVREHMLREAKALNDDQAAVLTAAQRQAAEFPWFTVPVGGLLLGCLVAVQIYLTRRTRRRLNLGLVLATAATLGVLVIVVLASWTATRYSEASRHDGTIQLQAITELRVTGMQARSDEAMTLIARDNDPKYFSTRFDSAAQRLTSPGGLIDQARLVATEPDIRDAIDVAAANLWEWLATHEKLRTLDQSGDPVHAISLASGRVADLAADYDSQLIAAGKQASDRLRDNAQAARDVLSGVAGWVAVLLGIAVLGAVVGMWPRIAEYR